MLGQLLFSSFPEIVLRALCVREPIPADGSNGQLLNVSNEDPVAQRQIMSLIRLNRIKTHGMTYGIAFSVVIDNSDVGRLRKVLSTRAPHSHFSYAFAGTAWPPDPKFKFLSVHVQGPTWDRLVQGIPPAVAQVATDCRKTVGPELFVQYAKREYLDSGRKSLAYRVRVYDESMSGRDVRVEELDVPADPNQHF
jgi:hypothetical protein